MTQFTESLLPPPVLTKSDFVRRYELEEFGNRAPTWNTLDEFLASGIQKTDQLVHIRNRVAGGQTWYNITANCVGLWTDRILQAGKYTLPNLYYSLMCPTEHTTIQGEVYDSCVGLTMYYSTVKKPMREALKEGGRQVGAVASRLLLQQFLNFSSYSWMEWLLHAYPDHVIEFTALNKNWGTEPGHNTLFWEVRKY